MKTTKKLAGFVAICSLVLILTACQNGAGTKNGGDSSTDPNARTEPPGTQETRAFDEGVVVGKDEQGRRLLVTQAVNSGGNNAVRAIWFTISDKTQLTDSRNNALSFHQIEVGHRVEAWYTGAIDESFPEQAGASKIVLLPEPSAPSGWVSRQTAVKTALADAAAGSGAGIGDATGKVWAVKDATPNLEEQQWNVTLVAAGDPEAVVRVPIDATSGKIIYAQNGAFRVFQPKPSQVVGSSFTVSGKARVFEAVFGWELEDGHRILAEGRAMAKAGAPEWGDFEIDVRYNAASNPSLSLILFVNSPRDGQRENELIVPLKPENGLIRYGQ